jgi:OOP family OmpA-OmpF porin
VGLGAPTPDWAAAATAGIAAVRELGGGRYLARDLDARLVAPDGAAPEQVAAARATLAAALPDPLRLAPAPRATVATAGGGSDEGTPEFAATLAADGTVTLAGPVRDELSQAAIRSYAAAVFGHGRVNDATVLAEELPEGWPTRVLSGVEALSLIKEGRLAVTEQAVALEGSTLEAGAAGRVRALLAQKDVGTIELALRFDAAAAAEAARAAAVEADPEGACADRVAGTLAARRIVFRPGSAELEAEGVAAVEALAAALADCPDVAFEIGGHTDSQGREAANLELSEARAAAVKAALDAAGLPHVALTARGYGPSRPVADNDTEAGRAANRRIEFTLMRTAAAAEPGEPVHGPRCADPRRRRGAGGRRAPRRADRLDRRAACGTGPAGGRARRAARGGGGGAGPGRGAARRG